MVSMGRGGGEISKTDNREIGHLENAGERSSGPFHDLGFHDFQFSR
jgi:hypothetical protein